MKNKIISIFLIILLIFISIFFTSYYESNTSHIYHQHLEDSADESVCGKNTYCSHLPIININTNNQKVPFKNIDANSNEIDYIIGSIEIYDNGNEVNYLGEKGDYTNARIRYRGRSSLNFDKKSYLIKLVNDKNQKINKKFLGMPSDSEWVLNGPFIDKTLIRNYMWYNISQEIMGVAPKTRFLELYVDNEYQGVYLAVEAVTQSENSRVIMEDNKQNSIASSYLLQVDVESGTNLTDINTFSEYTHTLSNYNNIIIKYPQDEDLTENKKKYIYDDFAEFEKMLYSFDYKEYKNYIDVDNFVDYFIINEFTQNYDAGYLSTYIYKDITGKYKMYIWDFNSANNNYEVDYLKDNTQSFELNNILWYEMLIKDSEFVEAIIERYENLRETYLSDEYLNDYIDETVKYLGPAINRNYQKWGYTFNTTFEFFTTNYLPTDYNDAIKHLKDSINKRAIWMDKHIYDLRQYSHESRNKNYNK